MYINYNSASCQGASHGALLVHRIRGIAHHGHLVGEAHAPPAVRGVAVVGLLAGPVALQDAVVALRPAQRAALPVLLVLRLASRTHRKI